MQNIFLLMLLLVFYLLSGKIAHRRGRIREGNLDVGSFRSWIKDE